MADFSQGMLIAGIAVMLLNIYRCIRYFYIKRDVIASNDRHRTMLTMVITGIFVLGALAGVLLCFFGQETLCEGAMLLVFSLVLTVMLAWTFQEMEGVKEHTIQILETVLGVLEAGDENLDGHSLHVKELSMLLYDYLPEKYRRQVNPENLKYASLLLDLGKLGVPRNILDKSGKLKDEEWEAMKRHPEIGVKVLKVVPSFDAISDWILYHHERVDGSGYHHLKGEEIPLASRIMAVADTYSALTMTRCYKPSMSYEDAVAELKIVSGTQLDSEIVNAFCSIPKENIEICMNHVKEKMKPYTEECFRNDVLGGDQ